MRYQGKITNWKDDQGFGFVTPNGGGEKAFVHIKTFMGRPRRPIEGDLITYELATDEKRRFQAKNIRFSGEGVTSTAPQPHKPHKQRSFGTIFLILFCSFLALAVFMGRLPAVIPGVYLAASALAFLAYAMDKSAAKNNRWRIRERTLHLLGIVGGWPGALLAQKMLRHKSQKEEFKTLFWATIIINCCALGWLLTRSGSIFLNAFLGLAA
jgi:uncharacterized membrane protein YsdA (DUF1294 family)/cold shock CspA family protein